MPKIPLERLESSGWAPPWTRLEHSARYEFANRFVDDKVVVDCACGDGTSSAMFGKTARSVNAFDVSSDTIERAKERNQLPSVVYRCASAMTLPMDAESADVFISFETIEHIDEAEVFLDEVVRVIRDEGLFICSTPDRDVHSPGNTLADQPWTPFHIREYSANEFSRMLKDRFETVEFYGQNPASVRTTDVKCWIGRKLSRGLVLRFNQVVKLRWFLWSKRDRHGVVPTISGRKYEYLVAVCSNVIRSSS